MIEKLAQLRLLVESIGVDVTDAIFALGELSDRVNGLQREICSMEDQVALLEPSQTQARENPNG